MSRLFGTDGVRGVANRDLTPDLVLVLGRAAGLVLAPDGGEIVVGRDTRLSGPMLEGALLAGLSSAGAEVALAGVVPTPAVAFLTVDRAARAGAMISASHNPVPDNGVKFFSDEGLKTSSETEDAIEQAMQASVRELPAGEKLGRIERLEDAASRYVEHLLKSTGADLEGLKLVLDCAFGAAYEVGPQTFRAAGAEVVAINDEPDGSRINVDCGSTSLESVARRVGEEKADLGLAFDGDADRVLAVDENGNEVDGDRILGLTALRLKEQGALSGGMVVVTVMSNLGFIKALEARGVEVRTAPVGDKFVADVMRETGAALGGEQSGHIIFAHHATTGDGVLAGLQVACSLQASGEPMSRLAHFFEPYPQVLISVPVKDRGGLEQAQDLWDEVEVVEKRLGREGRVLLRASGTEPVVRVMVEAAAEVDARRAAEGLAVAVKETLG
ncbi:MAG: phosphoglucosamine mutase [Actinomycetota bacterium]|nr:phosphoglucosamine mutase [Actinomycetota bacterium]